MVVSVGIDVSKDKHDCFILNSEGEILSDVFTIPNSLDGFTILLQRIRDCSSSQDNIKVGLEACIGQKHSRNRSRIDPVSLRLSETKALSVKVCEQGVQDIGG